MTNEQRALFSCMLPASGASCARMPMMCFICDRPSAAASLPIKWSYEEHGICPIEERL